MPQINNDLLATQNKTLAENCKNSASKLFIEGPILLVFANLSQILFEVLLVIAINKVQSFSYN